MRCGLPCRGLRPIHAPRAQGSACGRPLAGEIREEDKTFAADGRGGGGFGKQLIRILAELLGLRHFVLRKLVAIPLQTAAGGEHHSHLMPLAGDGVTECVQPPVSIELELIAVSEDDAAGSEGGGDDSRFEQFRCRPRRPPDRRRRRRREFRPSSRSLWLLRQSAFLRLQTTRNTSASSTGRDRVCRAIRSTTLASKRRAATFPRRR